MRMLAGFGLCLVLLVGSAFGAGTTKQTYTNKSGTIVGRSYTSNGLTKYHAPNGKVLGYSRETTVSGKPAVRVMDSNGSYKGFIMDGLIRDANGRKAGAITTKK